MLEASNLGQILGRLMCAEAGSEAEPPRQRKRSGPKLRETGVAGRIRSVLRQATAPMDVREIAAADGTLTSLQVATTVSKMPDVEKSGERRSYGYALRKVQAGGAVP